MIYINSEFKKVDVAVAKAKDETAKFCDKHNFRLFGFEGKEVKAAADDKATKYLVEKAVKLGAKLVK